MNIVRLSRGLRKKQTNTEAIFWEKARNKRLKGLNVLRITNEFVLNERKLEIVLVDI